MIVMKFGGTSLKDAGMFKKSAEIVLAEPREKIVVVSAVARVTDDLIDMAKRARDCKDLLNDDRAFHWGDLHESLQNFYFKLLGDLFSSNKEDKRCLCFVRESFSELKNKLRSVAVLGELTPRTLDAIMSFGEILSAQIFSEILCKLQRCRCSCSVSSEVIRTNANFGKAEIDFTTTTERLISWKNTWQEKIPGIILVVPGFVGQTMYGSHTTLGRNGSDYTAAAIANIFGAEELQIWKEVDGIMRADPKLIPEAEVIGRISYEEAMEMTYFGSKVLHSKSILPAVQKKIPICIKNTCNPDAPGTLISSEGDVSELGLPRRSDAKAGVKVITSISDLALVNVVGRGMMGVAGISARVFGATARIMANVIMISQASSEYSICFVVQKKDAEAAVEAVRKEFELEFHHKLLEKVEVDSEMSIVAVVGEGMRGKKGIAAKFFNALADADVNVIAIAQGSSERNISVLIASEDIPRAVRSVYNQFFGGKKDE